MELQVPLEEGRESLESAACSGGPRLLDRRRDLPGVELAIEEEEAGAVNLHPEELGRAKARERQQREPEAAPLARVPPRPLLVEVALRNNLECHFINNRIKFSIFRGMKACPARYEPRILKTSAPAPSRPRP